MATGTMRWGGMVVLLLTASLCPLSVQAQRRADVSVSTLTRHGAAYAAAADSLASRSAVPRVMHQMANADSVEKKSSRSQHIRTGAWIGGVVGFIGGATFGGVVAWGGPGEHPDNERLRVAGGVVVGGIAGALVGALVGSFLGSLVP